MFHSQLYSCTVCFILVSCTMLLLSGIAVVHTGTLTGSLLPLWRQPFLSLVGVFVHKFSGMSFFLDGFLCSCFNSDVIFLPALTKHICTYWPKVLAEQLSQACPLKKNVKCATRTFFWSEGTFATCLCSVLSYFLLLKLFLSFFFSSLRNILFR